MSYVVQLWESPVPDSLDQACEMLERLSEEGVPAPAPDKFRALIARLVAHFPQEVGAADPNGPTWLVPAPPRLEWDGAVFSLALYGDGPAELIPVLEDEAQALGLVLLDEQAGTVQLPDGRLFGHDGRLERSAVVPGAAAAVPPDWRAQRLSERLAQAMTRERLLPALAPLGFRLVAGENYSQFRRRTEAGEQVIQVTRPPPGTINHQLTCRLELEVDAAIETALAPMYPISVCLHSGADFPNHALHCQYLSVWEHRAETSVEFSAWLEVALDLLLNKYIPFLNRCQTAADILREDEENIASLGVSISFLALAHSLGRQDLGAIIERQVRKFPLGREPEEYHARWVEQLNSARAALENL